MFTLEEAKVKLAGAGQEHLLQYFDELDEAQQTGLLNQIEALDLSLLDLIKDGVKEVPKGKLAPLGAVTLDEIKEKKIHIKERVRGYQTMPGRSRAAGRRPGNQTGTG